MVSDDSSRLSIGSDSGSPPPPDAMEMALNIFGVYDPWAESAHLMPNSSDGASLWLNFVPSVLCRMVDVKKIVDESHVTSTDESKSDSDDGTRMELSVWNFNQQCIHGFPGNSNAVSEHALGIKHFLTNRIYIKFHEYYLGRVSFCLLIIPILGVDDVTNWKC